MKAIDLGWWMENRRDLDECPWPGPRPLETDRDESELLIGRDKDCDEFLREVDTHSLMLLTGPSGVGKTSLLEAGLVPKLRVSGYKVAVCRFWGGAFDAKDPASFLAEKMRQDFQRPHQDQEALDDLVEGPGLFWDLEDRYGSRAVIVLDQFEELIRFRPAVTAKLYELILDLNHGTKLKIVISFRDEYLHLLRPVEKAAKQFTITQILLKDIDDSFALDVVNAADRSDSRKELAIDSQAAVLVANHWLKARQATANDPFRRIGLLHLQALLYVLHSDADGGTVTRDMVIKQKGRRKHEAMFVNGLMESIAVKLLRCRKASAKLDPYLVEGTAKLVARSVKHLSSSGFKLYREVGDLARTAMESEFASLLEAGIPRSSPGEGQPNFGPISEGQFEALFHVLVETPLASGAAASVDLISGDRHAIAEAADAWLGRRKGGSSWSERLMADPSGKYADPAEVTCGPMFGMSPAAVLIEELRRFAFALVWLQESSLIRISSFESSEMRVSLIHDGFGDALEPWSRQELDGPTEALHAITAPRGASFEWLVSGRSPNELKGGADPKLLVNLRWKGAGVNAHFERVVFVNCDLRGCYFFDCRFTNATFVNCLLDGAMFSDCVITGPCIPATGGSWAPPSFLVKCSETLSSSFAQYQGVRGGIDALFSAKPGLPARPATKADQKGGMDWSSSDGGMVIYGGRISTMLLRSCRFVDGGQLSLRCVAGAGLDVVEQRRTRGEFASIEIFKSAMRHLQFTGVFSERGADFRVTAIGSFLAQVWFGDGLKGYFKAIDCKLIDVWNGSKGLQFIADPESNVYGAVNVTAADKPYRSVEHIEEFAAPPAELLESLRSMDYRRNPSDTTEERSH